MNIGKETITAGGVNFVVVRFSFDAKVDSQILNQLAKDGNVLAQKLNPVLAREASRKRDFNKVLSNAIAGEISEFCWRTWIDRIAHQKGVNLNLSCTDIDDHKNQVDIVIEYDGDDTKNAEVRSSFPYAGLTEAITRNFDIIGWYYNEVKIDEVRKDYYLRVLFPFKVDEFMEKIKEGFDACLCGGASRKLLEESPHSRDKEFVPYDEIDYSAMKMTKYRVVEPIINAYDTDKITDLIIKGNQQ